MAVSSDLGALSGLMTLSVMHEDELGRLSRYILGVPF